MNSYAEIVQIFLYTPALLYIANKQPHSGVRRVMEAIAVTNLIYNGVKMQYNKSIEKTPGG